MSPLNLFAVTFLAGYAVTLLAAGTIPNAIFRLIDNDYLGMTGFRRFDCVVLASWILAVCVIIWLLV